MTLRTSVAVANARLDALEAAIGLSAILKIRTGGDPVDCAAPDIGAVLATMNLPADYMLPAAARSKSMSGIWEDLAADAAGTAGHFRIYASDGVTCHFQGNVTATGGGGDMEVTTTTFALGQTVKVTLFTLIDGDP